MRRLVVGRYSAGGGVCRKRRRADTVGFRTKGLSAAGSGMYAPDTFPAENTERIGPVPRPSHPPARRSWLQAVCPDLCRSLRKTVAVGTGARSSEDFRMDGRGKVELFRPDGLYAVAPPGRTVRDLLRLIRKAEGKGKRRWPESGPLFGFVLGRFSLSGPEAVRPCRNGCFRNGIFGSGSSGSVLRRPREHGYSRVVSSSSERISNVGFSGPAGFPAGLNQTESMPERTAPAMSVS